MLLSFFFSMRWKFGVVFFWMLALVSTGSAGTCPDGMIAYWRLEERQPPFTDTISANNAICAAQCPIPADDGAVERSARFDPAEDTGLSVAGDAFNWSATQSFAMELWVRSSELPPDQQVLMARRGAGFAWRLVLQPAGTVRFVLQDETHSVVLDSAKKISTPSAPLGARWHHVAVVRNGATGETALFVDGLLEKKTTQIFQTDFSSDSAPLVIGWSGNEAASLRFSGNLDEIAVYRRRLSNSEIGHHYYLSRHYCELYDYPVDIMPLGDSITKGYTDGSVVPIDQIGYRYDLWQWLNDDLCFVNFIGSEQSGQAIDPAFDPDHAGFGGITPPELATLLMTSFNSAPEPFEDGYYVGGVTEDTPYLTSFPNDVILLHIGTNGLTLLNISSYVDSVRDLLEQIDGYCPSITVLVARIILRTTDITAGDPSGETSVTHQYNDSLELMVRERIAAGDKLLMVDMESDADFLYVVGEDMADTLHPNALGYAKMAAKWYASLQSLLPRATLPVITSTPITNVAAGQVYKYQVAATGTPKPTFSLEVAPAGMVIDADSGLITWTAPESVGKSFPVKVVAGQGIDVDWAVPATQSFSVTINPGDDDDGGDDDGDDSGGGGGGGGGGCFIQSARMGSAP
jgi:hypothetical protein